MPSLVMEQAEGLLDKCDAQPLGSLKDGTIVLTATGRRHVLDAGAGCSENIVCEGELDKKQR